MPKCLPQHKKVPRKAVDVESSSSRKRPRSAVSRTHSNPPPRSPDNKAIPKGTPYHINAIGGGEDAQQLASTYRKKPWSQETVCDILRNGGGPPMVRICNEITNNHGMAQCAFVMPDGTITQDMCIHLNLLCFKYRAQITHLL